MDRYERWIRNHPRSTMWQSLERKTYLEALGRTTRIYVAENEGEISASALVAIDTTAFGLSTWEIARGPIWGVEDGEWGVGNLLQQIYDDAHDEDCLTLFISPQLPLPPTPYSLSPSNRLVHCEATRIVHIANTEEEILAQMKPKGRYNIKLAEKSGVTVRSSDSIEAFYALIEKTGGRDGFTHHPMAHYRTFLEKMPGAFLLLAYPPPPSPCIPIAGLIGVIWGTTGIYYYGASDHDYRALMAPYALQWESIRLCKAQGCTAYDLLGIAPPTNDSWATGNDQHDHSPLTSRHSKAHPWEGISSFKEKFGGTVVTYPPEQMLLLRPWVWRLLQVKRRIWK